MGVYQGDKPFSRYGKSAYQQAVEGGYKGTQEEFNALLASVGKASFTTDKSLTLKDGVLSVNTTDNAEEDNTLPISSAGVHTQIGNIEVLLKTI